MDTIGICGPFYVLRHQKLSSMVHISDANRCDDNYDIRNSIFVSVGGIFRFYFSQILLSHIRFMAQQQATIATFLI